MVHRQAYRKMRGKMQVGAVQQHVWTETWTMVCITLPALEGLAGELPFRNGVTHGEFCAAF